MTTEIERLPVRPAHFKMGPCCQLALLSGSKEPEGWHIVTWGLCIPPDLQHPAALILRFGDLETLG